MNPFTIIGEHMDIKIRKGKQAKPTQVHESKIEQNDRCLICGKRGKAVMCKKCVEGYLNSKKES